MFIYKKHDNRFYIVHLFRRFSIKDLGPLPFFLGIEIVHRPHGLFLFQQ